METIFAVPMRNNNNNFQESGDILLSDWVAVADLGGIHVRIVCETISGGSEIRVVYQMLNSGVEMGAGSRIFDAVGYHEVRFSRSDFNDTTTVRGSIEAVGSARFSIEILSHDKGAGLLEWP